MKKKTLLLLISLLLSVMTGHAGRYEVFRMSGDVKLLKAGQWVTAKKREPVQSNDKVRIGDNSVIGIKDNETKGIFYCSEPGETMVSNIIISAKKQSKSTTSLLTGAMVEANGGNNGKSRRRTKRVTGVVNGVVMRGPAEGKADADSVVLPTYSNSFGNMLNDLLCDNVRLTEPDSLKISLKLVIEPEDSVVSYVISDRLQENDTMYVNVVRVSPGAAPQLMFDGGVDGENIFISNDSELTVDWYPSVYDPSARYMLIVCKSDYKSNIMQSLINKTFKAQTARLSKPGFIDNTLWNARTWLIEGQLR